MSKAIKKVGSLGLAGVTGGASLLGSSSGLKDVLLGKKQGGFSPDEIAGQIRGAQAQGIASAQKGLGELNKQLDQPVDKLIESEVRGKIATEQKGIASAAADARRNAQRLMAQRGLQGSSLGLSQDRSITQQAGEQAAQSATRANDIPAMIREAQLRNAQLRMSSGQGLFGGLGGTAGIRFQGQEGSRSGGVLGIASSLAPIAGTIMGGMAGGPMGMQAGSQLGTAVSGGLSRVQSSGGQRMSPGMGF